MKKHYERLSAFMLAFVLAIGVAVVWNLVMAVSIGPLWNKFRSPGGSEELCVLANGTPVIKFPSSGNQTAIFRTLDGKTLPTSEHTRPLRYGHALFGPASKEAAFTRPDWQRRIGHLKLNTSYPPYPFALGMEEWYTIYNGELDGRLYFAGYDCKSRLCMGFIGRNGFSRRRPTEEEQFRVDGRLMTNAGSRILASMGRLYPSDDSHSDTDMISTKLLYLLTDDGLCEIDLFHRAAKIFVKNDNLCSVCRIFAEMEFKDINRIVPEVETLALRSAAQVDILDDHGKQLRSYLIPEEIRDKDFYWYDLGDGKAMLTIGQRGLEMYKKPGRQKAASIYWFGNGGKVVDHREVALQTAKGTSDDPMTILAAPSPMIQLLGVVLETTHHRRRSTDFTTVSRKKIANEWLWLMVLAAVCVVLAWLCYRRQRAFGMPWTWMWVIFVLLLGVPGWLGYLAHRRWPTRLPCPHCNLPAPRDRPACLHCGRDFPAPAPTGAEVFA